MKLKRIVALITVAFGAFFTAMMLLNLWSKNIQNAFDGSLIGKTVLSAGMLSVAFIALLIVLKLVGDKK